MPDVAPTLAEEIGAAIAWLRVAGVDYEFSDDATAWLGNAASRPSSELEKPASEDPAKGADRQSSAAPKETQSPVVRANLLGDSPPQSVAEFREFWLTEPGLDQIGPSGRVAPRGDSGARLMVLVVEPEESDRDLLLSGPQGQLLGRMLNAMGLGQDEVYVASALPRHTPMADTSAIAAAGMDAVTVHHIKLAAPERVIAFGGNLLPLIGHELPKDALSLREINLVNPPMPLLMSEGLDSLMAMPRLKARFWRRWIEWSARR